MSIYSIEENNENTNIRMEILIGINLYNDGEQISFEEVGGICPNRDDQQMNCLTFRSMIIGLFFVLIMTFYHMWYYVNALYAVIPPVIVLLISHILGKVWSMINKKLWTMKEHTIVLIMSNIVWNFVTVYDFSVVSFVEYEERSSDVEFVYLFFFIVSIQFLGFGLAGILRRFLVWPSSEVWPCNFPSIALLRVLHLKEEIGKMNIFGTEKGLSLWKKFVSNELIFFLVVMIVQFLFYWLPGYIIPVLSSFSWICMIKPVNHIVRQLTDYRGLSLGSFSLNWYSLTFFLNSPLVVPRWAMLNIFVGFVLIVWLVTPIIYFVDIWGTHNNDISRSTESTKSWSALGLVTTMTTFGSLSSVFVHMFLYHRKSLWKQIRTRSLNEKGNDVHCRLISLYKDVPDYCFVIISIISVIVLTVISHLSKMVVWYNVLFSIVIPLIFVLPFGMVTSITGQLIQNQGVYFLMVIIVSSLWSGNQRKMMSFLTIGYTTYCQTLYLVSNMKLGHYMKIPPRILFFVQSLTCLICSSFGTGIQYYFYAARHYYKEKGAYEYQSEFDLTNVGSSIVNNTNFFDSSTSRRNRYFLWSILVGGILPIPFYFASKRYKWCHRVHIPLILATVSWMPLVDTGTLLTWIIIGLSTSLFFGKECWKRHVYLTSSALDAGMYLCLGIIGGPLVYYNIHFPNWWGMGGASGSGCPFSKPNAALQQSFNPQTDRT